MYYAIGAVSIIALILVVRYILRQHDKMTAEEKEFMQVW